MPRVLALRALVTLTALVLLLAAAPAHASHVPPPPPPPNDHFAAADPLEGSSDTAAGTTVGATTEPGEPSTWGDGRTIWFTWVAPANGTVVVDTSKSTTVSLVAAYTGSSVDALTRVPESSRNRALLRFSVVAGTAYHFQVDTYYGDEGPVDLALELHDAPANDHFAAAEDLTGTDATASADNSWATRETGEPRPGSAGGSLWYEWTAPSDGGATIDTAGSGIDTVLGVYTGDSVNALTAVTVNNDARTGVRTSRVTFRATAGTTYRIHVDGYPSSGYGPIELTLALRPPPGNDAFANAVELPPLDGVTTAGNNNGATAETGEPNHYGYYKARSSVWYRWTSPARGSLTIRATADFQTVLAAYTGDSIANLTRVPNQPQDWNGGPEQIRLRVEAGVTYYIAVDSLGSLAGDFGLSLTRIDSPANDDFADPVTLEGPVVDVVGDNIGATQEPCEPVHDDNPRYWDPSVWYEWTAPADGGVTVDTTGSELLTAVGIYTGDDLCTLTRVPVTRLSWAGQAAKRTFTAKAGVKYRIAVDGQRARMGSFQLSLRLTPPPDNDMFAAATELTGIDPVATGNTLGATAEEGEPSAHGGSSVWLRWTAPTSGRTTVRVESTTNRPLVYTGSSVGSLEAVHTFWTGDYGQLAFRAKAGVTYRIALQGGTGSLQGPYSLTLSHATGPPNDDLADALPIAGDQSTVLGSTVGATTEAGESRLEYSYANASVWYSWTAKSNGTAILDADGSAIDVELEVYTGASFETLAQVAESDDWGSGAARVGFETSAGTTYRIRLDGNGSRDVGDFKLSFVHRPPPPNNSHSSATPLASSPAVSVAGWNSGATGETGERSHDPYYSWSNASRSVWYRWTAPKTGSLTIRAEGRFQTVLAAYTGDAIASLKRVTNQPQDWNGGPERIRIRVEAGVTYSIAVDGRHGGYGEFTLSLELANPPPNDDFENPIRLEGTVAVALGDTINATQQPCEPVHGGNYYDPSVWYEWTAPADGPVTLDTAGSDFPTVLGIYTGDVLCTLRSPPVVDLGVGRRGFRAKAGVKYRIAVDGVGGKMGRFQLSLREDPQPANDDFADAQPLAGDTSVEGTNFGASTETGEPYEHGEAEGASVWYSWTATRTGLAKVHLPRTSVDLRVAAYSGDSVDKLTPLAYAAYQQNPLHFRAVAGSTYRLAVHGGWRPTQSDFTLRVAEIAGPPNDDFANAIELSGESGERRDTTLGATREPGERSYSWRSFGEATVWYTWTAPADGLAHFKTVRRELSGEVTIYTGDSVGALVWAGGDSYGDARLRVVRGRTYRVAVSSPMSSERGAFTLEYRLHHPPENDDFEHAIELTGSRVGQSGTTVGATSQPGEKTLSHHGGASVWYTWTAPSTGLVIVSSNRGTPRMFTGDSVSALTAVGHEDYRGVKVRAEAGRTYRIKVENELTSVDGAFDLTLTQYAPPHNDDFANAFTLTGDDVTRVDTLGGATGETGEPRHGSAPAGGASIWYTWTAPRSGTAVLSLPGYDYDSYAVAYTGDSLGTLRQRSTWRYSDARFHATAGQTYRIAVAGTLRACCTETTVRIKLEPGPANDDFEDAAQLNGVTDSRSDSTFNGTTEPGEPTWHGSYSGSVWYRWTAPVSGRVTVNSAGSDYSAYIAAYSGPSVDKLKHLDGAWSTKVSIPVRQGSTYYFAAGSASGQPSTLRLSLSHTPAPPNDDFANGTVLPSLAPVGAGDSTASTREPGEPANYMPSNPNGSVWYRWTAPRSGAAAIDLTGTRYTATYGVYTGSAVGSLTKVGTAYYAPGGAYALSFRAQEGVTYHVSIDGYQNPGGEHRIAIDMGRAPVNDEFASATEVSGGNGVVDGTNVRATLEPGESNSHGGASVWYRWTAPVSGPATFETETSGFSTFVSAHTGTRVDGLSTVGASHGRTTFTASAGTTYRIRVDSYYSGSSGPFKLRWVQAEAPPNDHFAAARVLSGSVARSTGTTAGATRQSGEPYHAGYGGGRSVWFSWRAPASGPVEVDTRGSSFDTVLAAYTGGAVSSLSAVAWNNDAESGTRDSRMRFDAVAGTVYRIAVDGVSTQQGNYVLNLRFATPPANDTFAAAQVLSGTIVNVDGSSVGATAETGEPSHMASAPAASVWYRWTAPASGRMRLSTEGSGFDTRLAAYRGTALDSLTTVAEGDAGSVNESVEFDATLGTTYWFAVDGATDGQGPAQGAVKLSLTPVVVPVAPAGASPPEEQRLEGSP
ncbi:MAG: hypothetical protein M3340_07160, partial [Actinomycetota bacterium]|nr:hypothetical protein [Actinomycetota bacterium]